MKKYFAKHNSKKGKLFLCILDCPNKTGCCGGDSPDCDNPDIIGEISPEATWVKEGDEFNEEYVRGRLIHFDAFGETNTYYKSVQEAIKYKIFDRNQHGSKRGMFFKCIEIKGPCGHFH